MICSSMNLIRTIGPSLNEAGLVEKKFRGGFRMQVENGVHEHLSCVLRTLF